ncbi:immunoglobulin domain-containing protein [Oleiharenicola sp. Vm1]|uniref:immunoglobulin domain-containing protein n=1 Tax=Oleiharenicola sp. Vm1 TaxID=3398393 RepID=UPI0039F45974
MSDFQFTSDDTSTTASYRNPPLGTVTELELTVFGAWGNVTATAAEVRALTEGAVPVITTQPRSVTVTRGSNVTFQVAATGAPTPSFQWFRNGTTLAGANTDTLVLANVQDAEAGSYTVTVTNSLGTVTSAPATLSLSVASPASAASGGGGGAPSWGFNAVAVLVLLRALRGNRRR